MAISLSKGGNISLSKTDPGIKKAVIGLGWDPRATDGQEFDLDASLFMLSANGRVMNDQGFIFYGQMRSQDGSIEHTGDNRSGQGEGDDEQVKVSLDKVPAEIDKLAITVTIHEAQARGQSFGQVANAFIRILNEETGREVARYDLAEDASTETAMIFGELYRHNGEWKFRAVGQGYAGGLMAMCKQYGVNAS
jgi:tellurium resistance protein TerD